jgi:phage tail sheath protein FI
MLSNRTTPGVYIQELLAPSHAITAVPTSLCAFLGRASIGPLDAPSTISSFVDFQNLYGPLDTAFPMSYAVYDFFNNGGNTAIIVRLSHPTPGDPNAPLAVSDYLGDQSTHTGIYQLETVALFNILCIPPDTISGDTDPSVYAAAATYCLQRQAMLLVDPPAKWAAEFKQGKSISPSDIPIPTAAASNTAVYFPRVIGVDPATNQPTTRVPCGAVAGIWAQTDLDVGVFKAPAGITAELRGISDLELHLTDAQNGLLSAADINCLRLFPTYGIVAWGARTLETNDSDWVYISVRRLALYIETSLKAGLQWAVFEPNDETLWAQLRFTVTSFMNSLWQQGALVGSTASSSYQVRCDASTTTAPDIDAGIVNIVILFAPVRPAEFIVLQIAQRAGQSTA